MLRAELLGPRILRHLVPWGLFGSLLIAGAPAVAQDCVGNLTAVDDHVKAYDGKVFVDVLANDKRPPGLALTVRVVEDVDTTCVGDMDVEFDAVVFTPSVPLTTGCQIKYLVFDNRPGSQFNLDFLVESARGIVFVTPSVLPPEIFSDGFESGDISAWSGANR